MVYRGTKKILISIRKLVSDVFSNDSIVEALRIGVSKDPTFVFVVVFVTDLKPLIEMLGATSAEDFEVEERVGPLVTAWLQSRLPRQCKAAKLIVRVRVGRSTIRTAWCDHPYGFAAVYDNVAYEEFHIGSWDRRGSPEVMTVADERCERLFDYVPSWKPSRKKIARQEFWQLNDLVW